MNEYVEILKRYIAENPPNYGSDVANVAVEDMYQRMHGMPLWKMARILDAVCALCGEHEKPGFMENVEVGILFGDEDKYT